MVHFPEKNTKGLNSVEDCFVAYSPERDDLGNPVYASTNILKVVVGFDATSRELACAL
ncbi:hypothetical protein Mal65_42900 [Crateriforma conspicua]|nr:hypothetical protein Mal65_42900 [Crateriforma conspicua]